MSSDVVYNSFQCRGITLKTDGSRDGEIHVFKPDGPCPEGKQVFEIGNVKFILIQQSLEPLVTFISCQTVKS